MTTCSSSSRMSLEGLHQLRSASRLRTREMLLDDGVTSSSVTLDFPKGCPACVALLNRPRPRSVWHICIQRRIVSRVEQQAGTSWSSARDKDAPDISTRSSLVTINRHHTKPNTPSHCAHIPTTCGRMARGSFAVDEATLLKTYKISSLSPRCICSVSHWL